jgi:hypothetical protein
MFLYSRANVVDFRTTVSTAVLFGTDPLDASPWRTIASRGFDNIETALTYYIACTRDLAHTGRYLLRLQKKMKAVDLVGKP